MTWVYFIKPIGMAGPIKIGCSCSPDKRRETLEAWCPFPLEILAEIEGDGRLERRFHARHKEAHKRGEWFEPTAEILSDIAAIAAGEFDINSLPDPERVTHRHRDNSYVTPEWRYRRSVSARLQKRKRDLSLPQWRAVWGDFYDRFGLLDNWLDHRVTIEAFVDGLSALPTSERAA